MKRIRVYEALVIIAINFLNYNFFVGSDIDNKSDKEDIEQASKTQEPIYSFFFRHCKKNFLEAFILDSDGAIETKVALGTKIQYRDGTIVLRQENKTLLYTADVIYVFNSDGILIKEIGK